MNSWGSNQGREGQEMTRSDLGLIVAIWVMSWVFVVGIVGFFGMVFI